MMPARVIALALLLAGCTGAADLVKALAADPATACVAVTTPYASAAIARANRDGVKVSTTGGNCNVENTGATKPTP